MPSPALGLIRQQLDLVGLFGYSVNDLGYDLGGGVDVFLTHNVGIRGDFRYLPIAQRQHGQ